MLYYSMYDMYYVMMVIPAVLFGLICQWKVSSTFKKYSKVQTRRRLTGAEAAAKVCQLGEARDVRIESVSGKLTDHYDPRGNVIRLSQSVYGESTVAALGVAAHEAGHAAQYAQRYAPIRLRSAILPVTQLVSNAIVPLVLISLFTGFEFMINILIVVYAVTFLFQLITLPVEFNASRRALALLESGGMLDSDEIVGARKVLSAAAMTYVAAMAVSLMQLLWILARRRR